MMTMKPSANALRRMKMRPTHWTAWQWSCAPPLMKLRRNNGADQEKEELQIKNAIFLNGVRLDIMSAGCYRPDSADRMAWVRKLRGSKIQRSTRLGDYVGDRLAMGWSPEEIAGRMELDAMNDTVSAEIDHQVQTHRAKLHSPWLHASIRFGVRRQPHADRLELRPGLPVPLPSGVL